MLLLLVGALFRVLGPARDVCPLMGLDLLAREDRSIKRLCVVKTCRLVGMMLLDERRIMLFMMILLRGTGPLLLLLCLMPVRALTTLVRDLVVMASPLPRIKCSILEISITMLTTRGAAILWSLVLVKI